MNNDKLLKEFARLLADTEDLLKHGFRTEHPELEISAVNKHDNTESVDSGKYSGITVQGDSPADRPAENNPVNKQPVNKQPVSVSGKHVPAVLSEPEESKKNLPVNQASQANQANQTNQTNQASGGIEQINKEIAACKNCNLYLIRNNTVYGRGSVNPVLMIVAPPPYDGAPENGNPLLPYEEEYLNKWLKAVDLDPDSQVFITPCVKCRTPGGRNPYRDEVQECSSFLRRQYKELKPKAVLALGDAACGALTGNSNDFPSLVAAEWTWGAVPALVLWTPAEVLANPDKLRKPVWLALQKLKEAWSS